MSNAVKNIQKKINDLEAELKDAQKRLPAHSVKPPLMHQIFVLEEELEQLYKLVEASKKQ